MPVNNDSVIKNDVRARAMLQGWLNSHNVNPELHIWPDEGRAYIASDGDALYPIVGKIINEYGSQVCDPTDQGSVNDAILGEYHRFCTFAADAIKDETAVREDINDGSQRESWLHTWEGSDGWYFCFSGVSKDGLISESEDVGPFESREDARSAALAE